MKVQRIWHKSVNGGSCLKSTVRKIHTKNNDYQRLEVLKNNRNKRYKYNEFFVEGVRNINEAIANHWKINSFLYTFEKKLSNWAKDVMARTNTRVNYELTEALMNEISNRDEASELIAIVQMREDDYRNLPLSKVPLIAVFDRPSNKGNLGTIIRSCDALGIDGLIITGHCVDLYDPETIVATMGSFFKVPVVRETQTEKLFDFFRELKNRYNDLVFVGSSAKGTLSMEECDLTKPLVIMIGNETEGLCRSLKEKSDYLVMIPMNTAGSASSLNVGCAASIFFYEANRQRKMFIKSSESLTG